MKWTFCRSDGKLLLPKERIFGGDCAAIHFDLNLNAVAAIPHVGNRQINIGIGIIGDADRIRCNVCGAGKIICRIGFTNRDDEIHIRAVIVINPRRIMGRLVIKLPAHLWPQYGGGIK